ncbi:MAG: trypsin-like peptidase domain-containing protein [Oscillospiraceae bacterium]|nr:trypsin-like peptidase domain-containing protein [Oscillospiraceae bacterium]
MKPDTDSSISQCENESQMKQSADTGSSYSCIPENRSEYEIGYFTCTSDYRDKSIRPRKKIKPGIVLIISSIAFVSAFSAFCMISELTHLQSGYYSPKTGATVILGLNSKPSGDEFLREDGTYTTAGIAKHVLPSVVEILTYNDITMSVPVGSGSGVILSEDGYIVTNAHVINNAKYLSASLSDKSKYNAEVIGFDAKTDIAVIKITTGMKKLTPAQFGNSDEVLQGEQVMAIGNPGGLTGSISGGYVSGIKRKIRADSTGFEMECIQTDAAISPGNSGGALVNMYGQVIGITSSKYVSSSYEGLGFAITINEAKPIIEELTANGYVAGRFRVGITFLALNEYAASAKDLPEGILVQSIDEECDIANSGIQKDDVITEVEGKKVNSYDSLMEAIEGKKAGDTVHAKIIRVHDDKSRETIDIEFKLMDDKSGNY